jgi:hypothetical protein
MCGEAAMLKEAKRLLRELEKGNIQNTRRQFPAITLDYLSTMDELPQTYVQKLRRDGITVKEILSIHPVLELKRLYDERAAEEYYEGTGPGCHADVIYRCYLEDSRKLKTKLEQLPEAEYMDYLRGYINCCVIWRDRGFYHRGKFVREGYKPELTEYVNSLWEEEIAKYWEKPFNVINIMSDALTAPQLS